ncbi:hypothetical protein THAOC_33978 [Thalassiosira oceanica]|uniref:Uncharacterized protein n=1 Tax=Thalassiosira oceanica TaxID=159749 RepID=K0RE31_THAOC|nr:hypothetical protein THAOC_33978 [Thalassiosira oceanica]|eukprot:EJK47311.1 hypothetical protein THAOC_33978 [Thalassiosira oceanica]
MGALVGMARDAGGRYPIIQDHQVVIPPSVMECLLRGQLIPPGDIDMVGGMYPLCFFGSAEAQAKLYKELNRLHDLEEGSSLRLSTEEDATNERIQCLLRLTTEFAEIKAATARWADLAAGFFPGGAAHPFASQATRSSSWQVSSRIMTSLPTSSTYKRRPQPLGQTTRQGWAGRQRGPSRLLPPPPTSFG